MSNKIKQVKWSFDLTSTTSTKRQRRAGTPPDRAYDLIGVDGSSEGGLRPFPGMAFKRDLTGNLVTDSTVPTLTGEQRVDVESIAFHVDANITAVGFVYRVRDDFGRCKYFLEYRLSTSGSWLGPIDLVNWKFDGLQPMSVTVVGRFVYVCVRGSTPFMFYIRNTAFDYNTRNTSGTTTSTATAPPPSYVLTVITDPGPGAPIELGRAAQMGAIAFEDIGDVLAAMTVPTDGTDAVARMVFFGFSARPVNTLPFESGMGGTTGDPIAGPSQLGLWAVPPQRDPSFRRARYVRPGPPTSPAPGPDDEPTLRFNRTGRLWREESRRAGDPVPIVKGRYTFAFQLFDSRTGRRSNLSKRLSITPNNLCYGSVIGAPREGTVERSETDGTTTWQGLWINDYQDVTFPGIEIIYDQKKYDTLYVYRSTRADETSPVAPRGDQRLLLENVINLVDYQADTHPPTGVNGETWRRSLYFFTLLDRELALQEEYVQDYEYDALMPKAGSSTFYEGLLLLGNMSNVGANEAGVSRVRYSEPGALSPELFSPLNNYPLQVPTEEVVAFFRTGPTLWGLTKEGVYAFRRHNSVVQGFPAHEGYGITGQFAGCTVAANVYYMSQNGLKLLDANGQLQDVNTINSMVTGEWASTLDQVHMAYDATMKAIFILNPALEHAVVLWLSTAMTTELYDMVFSQVKPGFIFDNMTSATSPVRRRAFFVSNIKTGPASYLWRIYTADYTRTSNANQTLMECTGTGTALRGTLVSAASQTVVDGTAVVELTVTNALANRIANGYIYLLDGPNAHRKARIFRRTSSTTVLVDAAQAATMLAGITVAGTRFGISPIYFRWTGPQLGLQDPDMGQPFMGPDFHRPRVLEQISCAFSGMGGLARAVEGDVNKDARFAALAWRGNDPAPIAVPRFPVGINGEKVESVVDGPSVNNATLGGDARGERAAVIFPSVEIVCPELTFTLLSVIATGSIDVGRRENRDLVGGTG